MKRSMMKRVLALVRLIRSTAKPHMGAKRPGRVVGDCLPYRQRSLTALFPRVNKAAILIVLLQNKICDSEETVVMGAEYFYGPKVRVIKGWLAKFFVSAMQPR
jgi:hypothetical protein